MSSAYNEDQLLALSGIQHFCFCRRQWGLIHVERQWKENEKTVEGQMLHNRTDDPFSHEIRFGIMITRSMPVVSYSLGLYGICDVVEFRPSNDGVGLPGEKGKFLPMPVEYKRGQPKIEPYDEVQLCAQALCLEEMFSVHIAKACFYYAKIRRRHEISLKEELRELVYNLTAEMHSYFERGYTPRVKPRKGCANCSLKEICLPALTDEGNSVQDYIKSHLNGY